MRLKKNTTKSEKIATIENFGILFCICVLSLFYVWQHLAIVQLGYQVKKKENQLAQLTDERARLELQISRLESPSHIQGLLAQAHLNLVIANSMNVVRLKKPLGEALNLEKEHWQNFRVSTESSLKLPVTAMSLAALEKKTDNPLS
jgi:cell division protein FtsB